jgi:hypothetical protein
MQPIEYGPVVRQGSVAYYFCTAMAILMLIPGDPDLFDPAHPYNAWGIPVAFVLMALVWYGMGRFARWITSGR